MLLKSLRLPGGGVSVGAIVVVATGGGRVLAIVAPLVRRLFSAIVARLIVPLFALLGTLQYLGVTQLGGRGRNLGLLERKTSVFFSKLIFF